jgi:hypothetical protein
LEDAVIEAIQAILPTLDNLFIERVLGTPRRLGEFDHRRRCCLACCLGLFGQDTLRDLEIISTIADAVRDRPGSSFDEPEIAKLCDELRTPENMAAEIAAQTLLDLTSEPE